MKTYQITLPDESAAFVDRAIADKKFDDVSHLAMYAFVQVESELRWEEVEDKEWLRKEIQIGLDQSARGQVAPLDMAAIWKRVQDQLASEQEAAHAAGHANGPG